MITQTSTISIARQISPLLNYFKIVCNPHKKLIHVSSKSWIMNHQNETCSVFETGLNHSCFNENMPWVLNTWNTLKEDYIFFFNLPQKWTNYSHIILLLVVIRHTTNPILLVAFSTESSHTLKLSMLIPENLLAFKMNCWITFKVYVTFLYVTF